MKIAITGATGFIGTALCSVLQAHKHELTALTRNPDRARAALDAGIECVAWGKGASGEWKQAVARADVVIHLAGESVSARKWTPEIKQALMRSRTETTAALVNVMREAPNGPQALICASGTNYYGDGGERELTEESPPGTGFLAEITIAWEGEARRAEEYGCRVVRHRIGVVLGDGGALEKMLYPLPVPISPWKLGLGGPIGNGRQWLPWIHLDDAVGLLVWSASNLDVSGAVNTVAPQTLRNGEFSAALGRALHRPAVLPIPGFAIRSLIGGFADELLTGQKVVPAVAQKLGYKFRYTDIDAAFTAIFEKRAK